MQDAKSVKGWERESVCVCERERESERGGTRADVYAAVTVTKRRWHAGIRLDRACVRVEIGDPCRHGKERFP